MTFWRIASPLRAALLAVWRGRMNCTLTVDSEGYLRVCTESLGPPFRVVLLAHPVPDSRKTERKPNYNS